MMIELKSINEHYKVILHSNISRDEKDKAYTNLLKYIEAHYDVLLLKKAGFKSYNRKFEDDNRKIIGVYYKISTSRIANRTF